MVFPAKQRDPRLLAAETFSFIPDPSSPAVRHPDSKFGRDRDTIPSPLLTSGRAWTRRRIRQDSELPGSVVRPWPASESIRPTGPTRIEPCRRKTLNRNPVTQFLPFNYSYLLSYRIHTTLSNYIWLRCKSAICRLNNDYVVCDAFDANRYRNL